MLNIVDQDILDLDFDGELGGHLTAGNSILTGATCSNGQLVGVNPSITRSAACDLLQWIYENTNYYAEIGTFFRKSHSYLIIKFFKKEDDELVREWNSGPIRGKAGSSKMSTIHEILGVQMLQKLTKHFFDNFEVQE